MKEIVFACKPEELSCIVGNLFVSLEPPCDLERSTDLAMCGVTHSGSYARLQFKKDYCLFYGKPEDLEAARSGRCIERRCERHG